MCQNGKKGAIMVGRVNDHPVNEVKRFVMYPCGVCNECERNGVTWWPETAVSIEKYCTANQ